MRTLSTLTGPALVTLSLLACAACAPGCSREPDGPAPASGARPSQGEPSNTGEASDKSPAGPTPTVVLGAGSADAPSVATTGPTSGGRGAAKGPQGKMNVLMISVDSLRSDMPWTGYERPIAPVMTELSKRSTVYTRFYSISSYTAMSLGGFLAGRYPSELERSGYFFGNYPDSVQMFPELLQKAGVRTLSAHAHFYFDVKAGFRQGFDDYRIVEGLSADNTTDKNITSPQHLALAKQMLSDKANAQGTFFAWFHLLDPHDLYMKHEGVKSWGKKARDLYDGEVEFTDKHIGELLEFVNAQEWGKRTAVVITSDHGEAFGEHKMYRHGFEIWEVLVHVPLIIHVPGASPRRIDVTRSAIDLAPTILELTGAPKDESMHGKSLVAEVFGQEAEPRDVIVDLPRTSDNDRRRALIRGNYKLIAYGDDFGYDLYDIVNDPGETKDIKRSKTDVFEEMKQAYAEKSATIKDRCPKMTEKLKGKSKARKC
jgi:arylsulfatase A-like enzyme